MGNWYFAIFYCKTSFGGVSYIVTFTQYPENPFRHLSLKVMRQGVVLSLAGHLVWPPSNNKVSYGKVLANQSKHYNPDDNKPQMDFD